MSCRPAAVAAALLVPTWALAQPAPARPVLTRLNQIGPAVRACWHVPVVLRVFERVEATVQFSLRVDGSLIGEPRLTFVNSPVPGRLRDVLARSIVDAVADCAPLPLDPGLGAAIAGRVFAIRFVYAGPRGRGA